MGNVAGARGWAEETAGLGALNGGGEKPGVTVDGALYCFFRGCKRRRIYDGNVPFAMVLRTILQKFKSII